MAERLIDANALLRDNEKYFCEPCKKDGHDYHEVACRASWVDDMRLAIEDAPTVDAVPVVRCRDCEHRGSNLCPMETVELYPWFGTKNDAFCSYGERRKDV